MWACLQRAEGALGLPAGMAGCPAWSWTSALYGSTCQLPLQAKEQYLICKPDKNLHQEHPESVRQEREGGALEPLVGGTLSRSTVTLEGIRMEGENNGFCTCLCAI